MQLRHTFLAAAALAVAGIAGAQAQSPFPPVGGQQASPFPPAGQQSSPFPPVGGQASPFPPVGQQEPQRSACVDDFMPLRQEVDKRFEAAKKGIDKRAGASEMCSLLTKFAQSESTLIKFVEKNGASCPFPPNLLETIKASHGTTEGYRKQACTAAAAPPRPARPAEPTLSDALAPPPPSAANTRTGRGTLDSLSGNPLAR